MKITKNIIARKKKKKEKERNFIRVPSVANKKQAKTCARIAQKRITNVHSSKRGRNTTLSALHKWCPSPLPRKNRKEQRPLGIAARPTIKGSHYSSLRLSPYSTGSAARNKTRVSETSKTTEKTGGKKPVKIRQTNTPPNKR